MKFGKKFRIHLEATLPEWRDKFLCYKLLKKLLNSILPPVPPPPHPASPDPSPADDADPPWGHLPATAPAAVEEWFVGILNDELNKFNDFFVEKEEYFVIGLQALRERIENVRAQRSGSEEMLEITEASVRIHGEMVLLKSYSCLNFIGLVKISKKYDKRTGGLLQLPFIQRALHQPVFTTEPLTRLVREWEATLELLFPLEPEVVEYGAQEQEAAGRPSDPGAAEASPVQDDTRYVYRSTLATMRTIEDLRRASSTYNPHSLGRFFHGYDDDGSGDLTAEHSDSDSDSDSSTSTLQNEAAHQESAHSLSSN